MLYRPKYVEVQAIQLTMDITYEKWGAAQTAKAGDWLVCKLGDTYTIARDEFAASYAPVTTLDRSTLYDKNPRQQIVEGFYYKVGLIEAEIATSPGVISTLEGTSMYETGDYICQAVATKECWPVKASKFHTLYEAV